MRTIKLIGLFMTVTLLTLSCSKPVGKMSEDMKTGVGVQMYSLRGPIQDSLIGIDSVIHALGTMGYKYVENFGYDDSLTFGLTAEALKATLNANGLQALSTHVRRDIPAEKTAEATAAMWAWWDRCIAYHKALGAQYIVMPSMPVPETLEGLQEYCEYYNQIGEKCLAAGLKFGYHNHSYEFEKVYDDGTVMYDYMVQHTDPAKVFFQLDVYWCQKGNRPAFELFEQYPNRFELLHIKDEAELQADGYVNFPQLFEHIHHSGAKYLVVEVEKYNMTPLESVKVSLDYLNELLLSF
jgi:sugar phosphate isomerase/epimerase